MRYTCLGNLVIGGIWYNMECFLGSWIIIDCLAHWDLGGGCLTTRRQTGERGKGWTLEASTPIANSWRLYQHGISHDKSTLHTYCILWNMDLTWKTPGVLLYVSTVHSAHQSRPSIVWWQDRPNRNEIQMQRSISMDLQDGPPFNLAVYSFNSCE